MSHNIDITIDSLTITDPLQTQERLEVMVDDVAQELYTQTLSLEIQLQVLSDRVDQLDQLKSSHDTLNL
jgi:peptide subunit release factor 1 (eRF1)